MVSLLKVIFCSECTHAEERGFCRFFLYLFFSLFLMITTTSIAHADISSTKPVQCYVTVNKALTWHHESVIVDVLDYNTKQIIQTLYLPAATKNKLSVNTETKAFDCLHHTMIQLEASYKPSIWSTDSGHKYVSQNTYDLYDQLVNAKKDNTKELIITVKFPDSFVGVPSLVD